MIVVVVTHDIEDAVELNNLKLARHITFDDRYNWKCNNCQYIMECNERLKDEIPLEYGKRRWWDTCSGSKKSLEVPEKWKKLKK